MDKPMPSGIKVEKRGDNKVEKVSGELLDKSGKDVDAPQKETPIPRLPPPILQRLVKNDRGW